MSATPRQIQTMALYEAQGYPAEAAAAWVGNASQEVGPNLPSAFRGPPAQLDHGSQGIDQWRLDRLTAYEAFVRAKQPRAAGPTLWAWYGRLDYQVEFSAQECRTKYPALQAKLMAGGDVATLTAAICWTYERPSVEYANLANRIKQAQATFATAPHITPDELAPQAGHTDNDAGLVPTSTTALNKVVIAQKQATKGGIAVAMGGVGTAISVAASHVSWHLPVWEWAVIGVGLAVAIICIAGAFKAASAASTAASQLAATPSTTESTMPSDYRTHVNDSAGVTAQEASGHPAKHQTVESLEGPQPAPGSSGKDPAPGATATPVDTGTLAVVTTPLAPTAPPPGANAATSASATSPATTSAPAAAFTSAPYPAAPAAAQATPPTPVPAVAPVPLTPLQQAEADVARAAAELAAAQAAQVQSA